MGEKKRGYILTWEKGVVASSGFQTTLQVPGRFYSVNNQ